MSENTSPDVDDNMKQILDQVPEEKRKEVFENTVLHEQHAPTREETVPISFAIGTAGDKVAIEFSVPVNLFALEPGQAKKFGQILIKRANDLLNKKFK